MRLSRTSKKLDQLEKIFSLVSSSNEAEAAAAAQRLRVLTKKYRVDLRILRSKCGYSKEYLRSRTQELWAKADRQEDERLAEQERRQYYQKLAEEKVRKLREKAEREKKVSQEEKTGDVWKFDQSVCPGENYCWVGTHTRRSSKGKSYEVRGHWRMKAVRKTRHKKAA